MRTALFALFLLFTLSSISQGLSPASKSRLKKSEDSMKIYSLNMIMEKTAVDRFIADSSFIKIFVRSLKTPYSFDYTFDSLQTISKIYAPDSSFRIFSWQWSRDDNYHRQRGAIQVKTQDGSLKLFPLLDISDFTNAPQDSVRTTQNWIGAIYYGIIMKTYNDKKYYTLLGFDENNLRSTKKWIEVLTFDQAGRPVFGGPYFSVQDGKMNAKKQARFVLEYKKEGKARMNYDPEFDMIVYDHLESETNENDKKYTLVPDGDYQGFKWNNGQWTFIDKVFDFKLKDGEAPMPAPLKDASGKSNEQILLQQSQKNKAKESLTPKKTIPKKPEVKKTQPVQYEEY
ncbi:MAG: hypothetical protein JWQ96_784 [Segetibacter sp.]|nr:hypothetical protein [Segetibacter sp.]